MLMDIIIAVVGGMFGYQQRPYWYALAVAVLGMVVSVLLLITILGNDFNSRSVVFIIIEDVVIASIAWGLGRLLRRR